MLIEQSDEWDTGFCELPCRLGVDVKEALLQLYKEHRVTARRSRGPLRVFLLRVKRGRRQAPAALG